VAGIEITSEESIQKTLFLDTLPISQFS